MYRMFGTTFPTDFFLIIISCTAFFGTRLPVQPFGITFSAQLFCPASSIRNKRAALPAQLPLYSTPCYTAPPIHLPVQHILELYHVLHFLYSISWTTFSIRHSLDSCYVHHFLHMIYVQRFSTGIKYGLSAMRFFMLFIFFSIVRDNSTCLCLYVLFAFVLSLRLNALDILV